MADPADPQDIRQAWQMLGRHLAELRKAAGYTQHRLAPLTLYGRSTIANAETGHQHPGRRFWQRCDEILDAEGHLVAAYDRTVAQERHHRRVNATAGGIFASPMLHAVAAGSAAGTPAAHPADAVAQLPAVDRRAALLAGIAAVAAASGLLPGAPARRVGAADVARLHAITALYRSVDYECGGGALYREVARFAEATGGLLDSSCSDALRPTMLAAIAQTRQLAGWTAFDAGRHTDAQRHWLAAERTALAAGDGRLAARIRYCQARQFQHLRHNRDAVHTLRLAREHLGISATPALSAMLDGAEAASLAALGDHQQAQLRLRTATDAYAAVAPDREPDWMSFFSHAEIVAQYGRVYRDMARHDPRHADDAVWWTSQAIAAFGKQNARSSLLNKIGLCSALFLAGEPDHALTVGAAVIDHAHQLSSARVIDRIHNLRRDLTRHTTQPTVREFAATLTGLTPAP